MESILRHIVNNSNWVEFIDYTNLTDIILEGYQIPSGLIIELINNEKFKKLVNKSDSLECNEHDLFLVIIQSCVDSNNITEINKFIKILSRSLFYEFIDAINDIMADDDYRMIKIINNCKYELLKPKYKYNEITLKSLVSVGIYRNLNILLSDNSPATIDSLLYQQRNKKLSKCIIRSLSVSKYVNMNLLISFVNPILAKIIIKNVYLLNIKIISRNDHYYEFPAFYYVCKTINKDEYSRLLISFTSLFVQKVLIEFQHRKIFNIISTILPPQAIKRKILSYNLIIQLSQIFNTNYSTKSILYFV